jgi:HEAT repeat protein
MRHTILATGLIALTGCASQSGPTMAHGKPIEHWVQSLQAPDAKLRKRAADVMGNVGAADPAVVPALAGALKDRDRSVREAAALALLKIGPSARDAAPALEAAQHDPEPNVRTFAARALDRIRAAP